MEKKYASPKINSTRLTGSEYFLNTGVSPKLTVLNYWQWAHSNLISNIERGVLAEFLVASALGVSSGPEHRDPWQDSDIVVEDLRVEVKSAAYIQEWPQEKLSNIVFARLQGRPVDDLKNEGQSTYKSDVYVLSLLTCKNNENLNILDLDQWSFWVYSKDELARFTNHSASIRLQKIEASGKKSVSFGRLKAEIMEKKLMQ